MLGGVLAVGLVLIVRLGWFQLYLHEPQQHDARVRIGGGLLETLRGAIYTADEVLLARDERVFDLSVHYWLLEDDPDVAPGQLTEARLERVEARAKKRQRQLKKAGLEAEEGPDWKVQIAALTGMPAEDLTTRASEIVERVQRIWESVQRRQEDRAGRRIKNLWIPEQRQFHAIAEDIPLELAILVRSNPERFKNLKVAAGRRRRYFHGALAPHVVGRCTLLSPKMWDQIRATDRDYGARMAASEIGRRYLLSDSIGAAGIERAYEDLLRGTRGYREKQRIFHTLRVETQWATTPPQPGADVYLTLKSDYQAAANEALQWAADQPHLAFTKGALVILNVRTGAILAAATYPSYDQETFSEDYDRLRAEDLVRPLSANLSRLTFRPTIDVLPTGSVYKLITAIAGLEQGKITPQTPFHCAGRKYFGGRRYGRYLHCTSTRHSNIQLLRAIEGSCNIYFFHVAELLSGDDLAEWGEKFGMAIKTGVEIAEPRGQMPSPTTRRSLFGRMNLAIGQGDLKCSPLQVARMCAAIANGGRLVQPHFFDYAVDAEGTVVDSFERKPQPIDVRPETLRVVREGMRRVVVGEKGTARKAGLGPFRAAGKTGTAELGKGMPNHCWFAGFAPFEDPQIAFAVVSERVQGGHGGSHAAPILARALGTIWPEGMP